MTDLTSVRRVPVSRASFALTDRTAFDSAIEQSLRWIARTARSELPTDALDKKNFNFEPSNGKAAVSAIRLDDELGAIWAAKVDFFGDTTAPDRVWTTDLFVEQRQGSFARFGAQLTCQLSDSQGFEHSRPRVVRDIIENLAVEADDESVSNEFQLVGENDVPSFIELIYRPHRRLPVLLVSVDVDDGAQIDISRTARQLSGTAHLRKISPEAANVLSTAVGKRMSAFNGAIRLYNPGLTQDAENPFEHPLWLVPNSGWNPRAAGEIARRILPLGFHDSDGDTRFWRVGLIRQTLSRAAANAAKEGSQSRLEAEVVALQEERDSLSDAAKTAESLMYEANDQLAHSRAEIERLEEENHNLRNRISYSSQSKDLADISLTPGDVKSVFDGDPTLETSLNIISSVFPNRVTILETAINSARDSFGFIHRKKAFELLWTLATLYWQALSSGESDVTARNNFGNSYAARESEKLSSEGVRRRTFSYRGSSVEMMKHLKIGVKDSKFETLRVHFEWFSDEQKIIIGYCGGHLDF